MSKFNTRGAKPAVASPVKTTGETATNYEGATGHLRDAKSELFLLAVANTVGENTYYETGGHRDDRYTRLVRRLAIEAPDWTAQLLGWLRSDGQMRSAAIVGAAEYAKARLDAAGTRERRTHEQGADPAATVWSGDSLSYSIASNRHVIASVLRRADEPGEFLAYWTSRYGRAIPKPVKRGIGDAVRRLYTERSLLKYDTASKGFRFGDVLELAHPAPAGDKPWQGDLFKYAIDRRHGRPTGEIPARLPMALNRAALMLMAPDKRREMIDSDIFRGAGMTWEALAGWLQGPMDAAAWQAVIPSMGYMALLRNLRNLDEAEVPDDVAEKVARKLADPEQVARSRQLPMRFYSAYNAAPSLRWGHTLEKALTASLDNIPALSGRTLVLVDTSSSMSEGFSRDGTLMRWDAAALFGIALGQRCAAADVVSFSSAQYYLSDQPGARVKAFPLTPGGSLLRDVRKWKDGGWFLGGGTDTAAAIRATFAGHDRVVIVTDEQAGHDAHEVTASIPETVPLYTWNLAGYRVGHAPSGGRNRHTFGGLTDAAFRMVPLLERGANASWPWEERG